MQNQVISARFNGVPVSFSNDAYLNATEIAKQFGKRPVDFLKTEQAQEYIKALSQKMSEVKKITSGENQWVIVRKGNFSKEKQGTWLHPKLAIVFARWLSAEFAVWCDEQIENMLHPVIEQQTITADQKEMIRSAVTGRHYRTGEPWQMIYTNLHRYFGVSRYDDIKISQYEAALQFIGSDIVNSVGIDHDMAVVNRGNLSALIKHVDWCYYWFRRITPAIEHLNPKLVKPIIGHFQDGIDLAYRLRHEGRTGTDMLPVKDMKYFPWDSDHTEQSFWLRRYGYGGKQLSNFDALSRYDI